MNNKQAFEIRGNQQVATSLSGVNAVDSALCNPIVLWRDRLLTLDVFQVGQSPPHIVVYCPLCTARDPKNIHNMSLTIRGEAKAIDIQPNAYPRIPGYSVEDLVRLLGLPNRQAVRGVLNVEKFRCSWEEDPSAKRDFGFAVCNWQVEIVNNVARDV